MRQLITDLFADTQSGAGRIENERGLQLELGLMFRQQGYGVRFEVSCKLQGDPRSTKAQKRDLDLLVSDHDRSLAIELKVPLAGRVPETMYDFCGDISFIEAAVGSGTASGGLCVLLTSDPNYWSGRMTDGIYASFRVRGHPLHGSIKKPTGGKDTEVYLKGRYNLDWRPVKNRALLPGARFLIVDILK